MNALSRILGALDGNIDLGAITGILGRVAALVARVPTLIAQARSLANEFKNDPRLKAFLDEVADFGDDVRGLLKLDSGEIITPEDIAAYKKAKWPDTNDIEVHARPEPPPPPPPTSGFPYMEVLTVHPLAHERAALLVRGNEMFTTAGTFEGTPGTRWMVWNGVGQKPNTTWPDPGGWSPIGVI